MLRRGSPIHPAAAALAIAALLGLATPLSLTAQDSTSTKATAAAHRTTGAHGTGYVTGAGEAPSDANIAAIVTAANTADIQAAELAQTRSSNADVKSLAQTTISDRNSVNKQVADLDARLHLQPEANATSRRIADHAAAKRRELDAASGAAFDKAYVADEVASDRRLLNTFDKVLIPDAKSAELKDLLTKARPALQADLKRARDLETKLSA
jgi:putative membrane protein